MSLQLRINLLVIIFVFCCLVTCSSLAHQSDNEQFVNSVAKLKPSVVGVGVYSPLATVSQQLHGTGFVVGDGSYIITNDHVISIDLDKNIKSTPVVFVPKGRQVRTISIEAIYRDATNDIALLKIADKLTPVNLTQAATEIADGTAIGITGFPIGAVLGLFPATHSGFVAAITPNIIPAQNSNQLSEQFLNRINDPLLVYQLDIVAYPGNSGSPVYVANTGDVFAVVNKVFVQDTRESAISAPSGITYAIPIKYVYALAAKNGVSL